MRFVMCGAGAIGGVLGGQLAKAGFEVIFIDKIAEHVAALNEHGLQLKGVLGNHTLPGHRRHAGQRHRLSP